MEAARRRQSWSVLGAKLLQRNPRCLPVQEDNSLVREIKRKLKASMAGFYSPRLPRF